MSTTNDSAITAVIIEAMTPKRYEPPATSSAMSPPPKMPASSRCAMAESLAGSDLPSRNSTTMTAISGTVELTPAPLGRSARRHPPVQPALVADRAGKIGNHRGP